MKKRTKQKDGYYVKVPKFDQGGFTDWLSNSRNIDTFNQGTQLAASGVNMLQPSNGDSSTVLGGVSGALSGAGEGAKIGSMFGPEGTVIGAGVGLVGGAVVGAISGNKKHQAYERVQKQNTQNAFFGQRGSMTQANIDPYGGNYALGDTVGGPGDSKYSPRDYTINYTNSPIYKQRLALTGGNTKPQDVNDLYNTKVTYDKNSDTEAFPKRTYGGKLNKLNFNSDQIKKLGAGEDEVEAHEWSHIARPLSNQEQFNIYNLSKDPFLAPYKQNNIYDSSNIDKLTKGINNTGNDLHDSRPDENKADLDALRYQMYKKGIYDTSKGNLDENTMKKALSDPDIKNSFTTKRLLQRFDPKAIIQMNNTIASTGDTDNTDIMNSKRYADGDQVIDGDNVNTQDDPDIQQQRQSSQSKPTVINIEKGELRIDAEKGKILQEYKGVNPLTGGLFEPHSKDGKDPIHNFTQANEGDFIVTKKKAKQYKDAVDNNDQIAKDTILMNIRNNKIANQGGLRPKKYADGDYIPMQSYGSYTNTLGIPNSIPMPTDPALPVHNNIPVVSKQFSSPSIADNTYTHKDNFGDTISKYGPSMFNIAQGLFGKVNLQPQGSAITNPYLANIQANMPKNVSYDSLIQEANTQSALAAKDLQNRSNNAGVYRANRQALASSTSKNIANIKMQTAEANNGVARQRAGIYENLGEQSVRDQQQLRNYNFGVNETNNRALAAKQGYLNTGLSQLQQTYMNDKQNSQRENMDKYQIDLLKQIYPALNPYGQFDPNYVLRNKYQ